MLNCILQNQHRSNEHAQYSSTKHVGSRRYWDIYGLGIEMHHELIFLCVQQDNAFDGEEEEEEEEDENSTTNRRTHSAPANRSAQSRINVRPNVS